MRRGEARRRPSLAVVVVVCECQAESVQRRIGMLWAKALAGLRACADDGGILGCRFPCWGIMIELQPSFTGFLQVKTLSRPWMSDGGTTGIVPSLEALSLETQLGMASRIHWS